MNKPHSSQATRILSLCLLVSLVLLSVGCSSRHHRRAVRQNAAPPRNYVETGTACWYGPGYHGKMTASGEIYNMNDMTAAHRTLPFDTKVRVTNLDNQASAVVRINDRGPFKGGRIIDVSKKAADRLGFLQAGLARVRIETAP